MKLFLKGERCFTDKCAIERRNYAPGQHGQGRRRKVSEYAVQLREKQRLKSEIVGRARAVAESTGGILGLGNKVCAEEAAILSELERAFES